MHAHMHSTHAWGAAPAPGAKAVTGERSGRREGRGERGEDSGRGERSVGDSPGPGAKALTGGREECGYRYVEGLAKDRPH
jgi:hypothetical protein